MYVARQHKWQGKHLTLLLNYIGMDSLKAFFIHFQLLSWHLRCAFVRPEVPEVETEFCY